MKAHLAKFILLLTAVLLAAAGRARAGAEAGQPHMEAALHFLQDAKTSATPGAALHSAKEELQRAAHDKHGFRIASLAKLDEAIAAVEAGDTQKTREKIDATITEVHDAMAHGRGSR